MTLTANWSYPTAIRFGAGRISEIAEACAAAGINRPLLITDRGLADLPITQRTLDLVEAAGLGRAIFSDVDPNPTEANMAAGIEAFKAGDHDGVIAFGGGSGLDLAKMVAFMARQTRPVWDFEDISDWWTRADADAIYPNIAVPTTAGTGSEVGRASVLTNTSTHQKKIIFHPRVLPSVVIADTELTATMPAAITAGTGMDALAHCIEAFSSPHYHPMSQGIALEGMALVFENLPKVMDKPGDLDARAHMMSAAMMGATAFQKGLGAVHALSHPIGAMHNTHHGTTNGVVMEAVMQFNLPAVADQFARAAAYCGVAGGADGFIAAVSGLRDQLGIPSRLSGIGVSGVDMDALVAGALQDPSAGGNPIALTEDNTRALFEAVL